MSQSLGAEGCKGRRHRLDVVGTGEWEEEVGEGDEIRKREEGIEREEVGAAAPGEESAELRSVGPC